MNCYRNNIGHRISGFFYATNSGLLRLINKTICWDSKVIFSGYQIKCKDSQLT